MMIILLGFFVVALDILNAGIIWTRRHLAATSKPTDEFQNQLKENPKFQHKIQM